METQQQPKPIVLIVEDDPMLIKMYKTKFTAEGFEVLWAEDGAAGLEMASKQKPGVIVLDIMMPKLSGIDMLKRLRAMPGGNDIVVIVLSNLSSEAELTRAKELGVKEYLLKANYTPKDVVERVKKYI